MTILNFWCTPERAVVAVDTATAWSGNGARAGEASKIVVLPGLRLAVASRGPIAALNLVTKDIQRLDLDFDGLDAYMRQRVPKILEHAFSPSEDAANKLLVATVGWSVAGNRMDAILWDSNRKQCTPERRPSYLGPRLASCSALLEADPFSKDAMAATMRCQLAWSETSKEPGGFGGRMVYVDMNRDRMTVDWNCQLEP